MKRADLLRELRVMVLNGRHEFAADLIHLEEDTGDAPHRTAAIFSSLTRTLGVILRENADDADDACDGANTSPRTLELIADDAMRLARLCAGVAKELRRVARRTT